MTEALQGTDKGKRRVADAKDRREQRVFEEPKVHLEEEMMQESCETHHKDPLREFSKDALMEAEQQALDADAGSEEAQVAWEAAIIAEMEAAHRTAGGAVPAVVVDAICTSDSVAIAEVVGSPC